MRTWKPSVAVLSLIASAWVSASLAADTAPTTKPAPPIAAAPIHHEIPGKGWIQVANKAGGFEFYVPKNWGPGSTGDSSDSFTLPAPPARAGATPAPNAPSISLNLKPSVFAVKIDKGKGTNLKAAVDSAKTAAFAIADDEGNKIDTDAATTLDGKPAWLLETEEKYVAGTVTTNEPNKPSKSRDIKHVAKTYKIIALVDGNLYDVSFVADVGQYGSGMSTFKKVLDTFAWLDSK